MNKQKTNIEVNLNVVNSGSNLKQIDEVTRKIDQIEKEYNCHCTLFKININ